MDWDLILTLVLVWAFIALAGVCLLIALWSLRWPSVKGTVEVSFVDSESEWKHDAEGSYRSESETHELAYSYIVRGDKFIGSNIKPWGSNNWSLRSGGSADHIDSGNVVWSGARDNAKWYRPGVVVDVYYCPWRPQWSCLEPGGFLVPLILGFVGAFFYFVLLR